MWKLGAVSDASRGKLEGEGAHHAHSSCSCVCQDRPCGKSFKASPALLSHVPESFDPWQILLFHSGLEPTQEVGCISYRHSTLLSVDHEFIKMSMKQFGIVLFHVSTACLVLEN